VNLLLSDPAFLSVAATISGGGGYDPDAQSYITAVEAADGQALETAVKDAINVFVVGCKADGIWNAIKASCILAGARTLSGALVPLKGTAPTNNNFVSGDYDRKTGLVGDGSTKYLDSGRNNNADPQNNRHVSCYANIPDNANKILIGARIPGTNVGGLEMRHSGYIYYVPSSDTGTFVTAVTGANFLGFSRLAGGSYESRRNHVTSTIAETSGTPANLNVFIFTRNDLAIKSDARIAFYSIGEALDLALLDARVSTLMTDIGAAIP